MPQSQNKPAPPCASIEKHTTPKNLIDEQGPFHCSAEWHLRNAESKLVPLIYLWAGRLSVNSGTFFPSVESIASYFGVHRTTVFRALRELEYLGFLEVVHREPGKPVRYRVVDHKEWQEKNPGRCITKEVFPWTGEGDPLARELYAISGGLAKFFPGQMKGLRAFKFSDEEIRHQFQAFLVTHPQKGPKWKSVYYPFHAHLCSLADSDARVLDSISDPSHVRYPHPSHRCDTPRSADATSTRSANATQVFEVSFERIDEDKATIPAPASQERSDLRIVPPKDIEGGGPPSKTPPKEKTLAPWQREADEKIKAKAEAEENRRREGARCEDALARAWKALDIDPQLLSASFRGVFGVTVYKRADAPVLDQLDTALSQMQRLRLEIEPCILEARERLANGSGAGIP
jgi:hypothetical protein